MIVAFEPLLFRCQRKMVVQSSFQTSHILEGDISELNVFGGLHGCNVRTGYPCSRWCLFIPIESWNELFFSALHLFLKDVFEGFFCLYWTVKGKEEGGK